MDNKNDLAFPVHDLKKKQGAMGNDYYLTSKGGVTKREYFAALAMQGILSHPEMGNVSDEKLAKLAVSQADALLDQLSK